MENEQNMQPDWAEKLVDDIREGARIDGEIRDKLSHGEAAALIRSEFWRLHEVGINHEAFLTNHCVKIEHQLAALSTVCAKQKEALDKIAHGASLSIGEEDAMLRCQIQDCATQAIALTSKTVADQIAQLQAELAPLRELVGVDSRAKSALTDIDHWRKMQDKADRAEAAEAKLAEVKGKFEEISYLHGMATGQAAGLREDVANLQAELKAAREATQWQPIETAPRNGVRIVCRYKDNHPYVARLCFDGVWIIDNDGAYRDATHWMPLPPAPGAARSKEVAS